MTCTAARKMAPALPPFAAPELIAERLQEIFPSGFEFYNYVTRVTAVRAVFSSIYIGAVEGSERWLMPKQVYRMSDEQAALTTDAARLEYARASAQGGYTSRGAAWYADTTREPIRDESLRQGLIPVGAVVENKALATTSNKGRYALAKDFVALFDPALTGAQRTKATETWRKVHLSAAALARIHIVRAGTSKDSNDVIVALPNGDTRRMAPGPSSIISKGVVEEFAKRFLVNPAVLWLSESGNKVVASDDALARLIGIEIDPSRSLPDVILVDLGPDERPESLLLIFVEVVASDGPISNARRQVLLDIATHAKIEPERVAFMTAYLDRDEGPLRKNLPILAWNSFVWIASEPENIIALNGGEADGSPPLHALLAAGRLRSDVHHG